jgi:hypothetical protein
VNVRCVNLQLHAQAGSRYGKVMDTRQLDLSTPDSEREQRVAALRKRKRKGR